MYVSAGEVPHRCVLLFEATPSELIRLRRTVRSVLHQWGVPAVACEAELAVSELATNVIVHVRAGTAATLVVEVGTDTLRVEMHDTSPSVPMQATSTCDDECGRGLQVLSGLASDWGILLTPTGKAVWCDIPLAPAPHHASVQRAAAVLGGYRRGTDGGAGGQVAPTS